MSRLNDDEYRLRQEEAHLLAELKRQPGWEILVAYCHAKMLSPKRRVLDGRCDDYTEYLKSAYQCVGIHEVLAIPEDLAKIVENEQGRRRENNEPTT